MFKGVKIDWVYICPIVPFNEYDPDLAFVDLVFMDPRGLPEC